MEFIEKLALYLTTNGINIPICGNIMNPDTDDVVCIKDTGSYKPSIGSSTRYPTVQISVRCKNYVNAKSIAMQIFNLLHDKEFYSLDANTVILASYATQEPAFLLEDSNCRTVLVANYNFTIRR